MFIDKYSHLFYVHRDKKNQLTILQVGCETSSINLYESLQIRRDIEGSLSPHGSCTFTVHTQRSHSGGLPQGGSHMKFEL